MANDSVTIDPASVFDNPTDRRVEFRGSVDGETFDFGVNHSVIQALTGSVPDRPATAFGAVSDDIARAAAVALARADGDALVVVSENDLDQANGTAADATAGSDTDEAEAHPS